MGFAVNWEYLFVVCRISVGLLLFASSITKFASAKLFKKALLAHDILPERVAAALSVVVPSIELATGSALLLNAANPVPGLISSGLFVSFGLFITSSIIRGKEVSCGCFGTRSGRISWQLVLRNMAFAGLSLLGTGKFIFAGTCLITPFILGWFVRLGSRSRNTGPLAAAS